MAINHLPSESELVQDVLAQCEQHGENPLALAGDVSADADCRAMAQELGRHWGELHAVVNNAGITRHVPDHSQLESLSAEDFLRIYAVNVVGGYQVTRACRHLLEAGAASMGLPASVVNVSSLSARSGGGSSIAYAASKGALNTMTLSLARALAPAIRVNAVCPSYIDSGWFTKGQGAAADRALRDQVRETVPLGVALMPEDVARLVCYLVSTESRFQTGELLDIDAGHKLVE